MEKHYHFQDYFKNKELTEIYISIALRAFSIAMIGVFVPLILLEQGYSLVSVLLLFFIHPAMIFITFLISTKLIKYIGVKHTMILSMPFLLLYFSMLYSLDTVQWPTWLLGVVAGFFAGLYWFAFHIEFANHTTTKKRGSQVGLLFALTTVTGIIAPLLGGFILQVGGVKILIVATATVLCLSGIPLMLTRDERITVHVKWKELLVGESWKTELSYFCDGFRSTAATLIWPIFLYSLQASFILIGSIYTILRVFNSVMSMIVGKMLDRMPAHKILKIGSIANGTTLFIRCFLVLTAPVMIGITTLGGISYILLNTPYSKILYDKAHSKGATLLLRREFYLEIGRMAVCAIGIGIYIFTQSIFVMSVSLLIIASFAALGYNLIKYE